MRLVHLFSPRQVVKVFYKPQRIPRYLKFVAGQFAARIAGEWRLFKNSNSFRSYLDTYYDIKFKPIPDKKRLHILEHTLETLAILIKNQDGLLPIEKLIEIIPNEIQESSECAELAGLFGKYGSDKSTKHDYYLLYFLLLKDIRTQPLQLLEIGLGTNDLSIHANMGREGRPGASLRAFRDFLPEASVYGADIDIKILFEETRISTFYIDQLNHEVLEKVKHDLGQKRFDLIIDDGLHNSEANFNTILFALDLLKPGGVLVVEDIEKPDYVLYQILSQVLKNKYSIRFIECRASCVCVIQPVKFNTTTD